MSPVSPVFHTIETVIIIPKFKRNKLLQSRDLNVHVRMKSAQILLFHFFPK